MRKPTFAAHVRTRLLCAGFAPSYSRRAARELQEHWDEIIEESLRNGLTEADARAEATQRLGSPDTLADEFIARLQRSSWLGRNPTLGFGVLAVALSCLWWIAFGSIAAHAFGLFEWDSRRDGDVSPRLELLDFCFDWIRATSYIGVPWLCCFIAQRYFCGWRPALWACLLVAIHNAMHFLRVHSTAGNGSVAWGYSFNFGNGPSLIAIVAPLAVFAINRVWCVRKRDEPHDSGPTFC